MDTKPARYLLSQGEVLDCPQTDQALAKKSWMYLFDHLVRNNEFLKAFQLVVPWHLEDDAEIIKEIQTIARRIECYADMDKFREHVYKDEDKEYHRLGREFFESFFSGIRRNPRMRWVIDKVVSYNPNTVLDIGAGWGGLAVEIAKLGMAVTAIAPHDGNTEYAKELQAERALQIDWHHKLFEDIEWESGQQFEVVLACEVIEHILHHQTFLRNAFARAKRALVLTTPLGAVDCGWPPQDMRDPTSGQHIRAFSETSLKAVLRTIEDAEIVEFTVKETGQTVFGPMKCFCVVLERIQ